MLHYSGEQFHLKYQACLKWMSLGGEVELSDKSILAMHEDGEIGYLVDHSDYGRVIMHCGSEEAWLALRRYARLMDEQDLKIMAMNIALTEHKRSKISR